MLVGMWVTPSQLFIVEHGTSVCCDDEQWCAAYARTESIDKTPTFSTTSYNAIHRSALSPHMVPTSVYIPSNSHPRRDPDGPNQWGDQR